MPFKSKAQMRYMFARHSKVARKWADRYGTNPPKRKLRRVKKKATKGGY